MHPVATRAAIQRLIASGLTDSEISRAAGIARTSVRDMRRPRARIERPRCPRCWRPVRELAFTPGRYAELLGWYLGDGHVSRAGRTQRLRISLDAAYPLVVADLIHLLRRSFPANRVGLVHADGGATVVASVYSTHLSCLFPQHGPGRKHERVLPMETWQWEVVERHPADFLRGLLHSDGARVANWATRMVAGERRRYDYPRWQFVNHSEQILGWCCDALDLVDVPWRRSGRWTVSVSTRAGVARLDELVGPKR